MKVASVLTIVGLMSAFAIESSAARLACWELYAKKGSKPVLTAEVVANDQLENIKIGTVSSPFGDITVPAETATEAVGSLITTNRSPYKGAQEFDLLPSYRIRLILPADLSPESLEETYFKAGGLPANLMKRQNGVLDMAGRFTNSGGSTYSRLHCTSN